MKQLICKMLKAPSPLSSPVDPSLTLFPHRYTLMERCCEVQLMVDQAVNASGKKKVFVDDQAAKYTHEAVGDPEALFCDFQPDYEMELELSGGTFLK